jgi:uncharacterized protein
MVKNKVNSVVPGIQFLDFQLEFLKEKAVWIPKLQALLIADLHFGKAAHFRKSGIPISESIHEEDLLRIGQLTKKFVPKAVYFLGDLFHSDWNGQWETLTTFLSFFPDTEFHLIKGNHDVLPESSYKSSSLTIHSECLRLGPIILSHEPLTEFPDGFINVCGHIHPGIRIHGKGRQSLRLPCFFLKATQLVLPAFGSFTGIALIQPKAGENVWAVSPQQVIPILSGI